MHSKTALLCISSFPRMNTDASRAATIFVAAVVHLLRSLCWRRRGPMGRRICCVPCGARQIRAEHPHWWCQTCQLGADHWPKTQRAIAPAVELRGTRVQPDSGRSNVIFSWLSHDCLMAVSWFMREIMRQSWDNHETWKIIHSLPHECHMIFLIIMSHLWDNHETAMRNIKKHQQFAPWLPHAISQYNYF